jgi:hypothetical protein
VGHQSHKALASKKVKGDTTIHVRVRSHHKKKVRAAKSQQTS